MNALTKKTVFVSALIALSTFGTASNVNAQEAALVYASNVTATQSLNDINTQATPQMLARDYSKELLADMDVRLPEEHAENVVTLRIKDDLNDSILEDLDVRLKQEMSNLTASIAD